MTANAARPAPNSSPDAAPVTPITPMLSTTPMLSAADAPLAWARDSADWPLREHSRFVEAGGLRWHVQHQALPGAPRWLLVHGTGASTHSWRRLVPLLDGRCEWLAVDLPGHAFSGRPPAGALTLPGMADALAQLLAVLGWQPTLAVGHSAGAAILVRMALDGRLGAGAIAAINGAFLPFGGWAAPLFSPLARVLYAADWVPHLFARRAAQPAVVQRLIEGTGSRLDAEGRALYGRLMSRPAHTEGALGMMAHWDLRALAADLPRLRTPLHLLVGEGDRAVPPSQARRVQAACPVATLKLLFGVGHLAHEEDPLAVADWLASLASPDGPPRGARV